MNAHEDKGGHGRTTRTCCHTCQRACSRSSAGGRPFRGAAQCAGHGAKACNMETDTDTCHAHPWNLQVDVRANVEVQDVAAQARVCSIKG